MKRYLATFYRRRWFYSILLFLLLGMTAIGMYAVAEERYRSTARIWVVGRSPEAGAGASPAQQQLDILHQLVQTDAFVAAVLRDAIAPGGIRPQGGLRSAADVRAHLAYTAEGPNTVSISFSGGDPEFGPRIVRGTIAQLERWMLESRLEQDAEQMRYYQEQLRILRAQARESSEALRAFEARHPNPMPNSSEAAERAELSRVSEVASDLYTAAEQRLRDASVLETGAASGQPTGFRVLDPPSAPETPSRPVREALQYLILGIGASVALLLTTLVFVTWQDRVVRTPEDLESLTNLPVLARLPHLRTPRSRWLRGGQRRATGHRASGVVAE